MERYDSAAEVPPSEMARSASSTWREPASGSEKTATVRYPRARAVRMTRQAISPRFAISTVSKLTSHPRDPERVGREAAPLGFEASAQAEREHPAAVARIDQAVVPQARGA